MFPWDIEQLWPNGERATEHGPAFARVTRCREPVGNVGMASLASAALGSPWLPAWQGNEPIRLSDCLFLDTETTGLNGGTGTYLFLVGLGYIRDGELEVCQFFLRDLHEERAMLAAAAEVWERYSTLVTFNGRAFDIPLLQTRHVLQRMRCRVPTEQHLDLLWPARRLWSRRLPSCALSAIEREVFGSRRDGDIPGAAIPALYYAYLRHRDVRSLAGVIEHNRRDIAALVALAVHLSAIGAHQPASAALHPVDALAMGRIYDRRGDGEWAGWYYEAAIKGQLPTQLLWEAYHELADLRRRQGRYGEAAEIWHHMVESGTEAGIVAAVELAKYFEHRLHRYEAAHRLATAALTAVQRQGAIARPGAIAVRGHQQVTHIALEGRIHRLAQKLAQHPQAPPTGLDERAAD